MDQTELIAGDSLSFPVAGGDYPASAGWVLSYLLVPRFTAGSPPQITISSTADGSDFQVAVAASITSGWAPGDYTWYQRVIKGGTEKYTVAEGQLTIKPNPEALAAGYDGRTPVRKALEQLRSAYYEYVSSNGTKQSYRIGEREMTFRSTGDIIKQITYLEQKVAEEDAMAGRTQKVGRRIHSRI